MAWGGNFVNALSSAWDIVQNFVQRIADWFSGQSDVTEEDVVAEVDGLADRVGGFEVAAAIESEVMRELYLAGVLMVESIAQPGACEPCLDRAAAGPTPINDFEPPPYHGGCRCSTSPSNENRGVKRSMANNNEQRTYTITGSASHLDQLEKVLSYMQYLGNIGSSRNISIFCDGDGAVRLKVNKATGDLVKPKTEILPSGDMGINLG